MKRRITSEKEDHDVEEIERFVIKKEESDNDGPKYSKKSKLLMAKMGYREGEGLGKEGQGRVEPITASQQKGTSGFGAEKGGLEKNTDQWDYELEELYECEKIDWLSLDGDAPIISLKWLTVGQKKLSLEGENQFCKEGILKGVIEGKCVFDEVKGRELLRARNAANQYEKIGKAFFMNRAAMKMANMDAKFGYMFTKPTRSDGGSLVGADEVLSWADVCAGPGGFSEYVLWRSGGFSKGFGITLKSEGIDFSLCEMKAGPPEMFEPHYGLSGDGNIYSQDNQSAFRDFVMAQTKGRGVHFVMADGGFSVEGQEVIQEVLSHRLYLCQAILALNILAKGGHFVCKLFDLFTSFSCGLVYLLYLCFERVCIFKPLTSRPANSERYLVCQALRRGPEHQETLQQVLSLMQETNRRMQDVYPGDAASLEMVTHIVPMEVLKGDSSFIDYVTQSNNFVGYLQCVALRKVQTFLMNSNLLERRGEGVKERCMQQWAIPHLDRKVFIHLSSPLELFNEIIEGHSKVLRTSETLTMTSLKHRLFSSRDHLVCVMASTTRYFLLSKGYKQVYRRKVDVVGGWESVTQKNINLPTKTLLEVEYVDERKRSGQTKRGMYHIIDILAWAGKSMCALSFQQRRHQLCVLFKSSIKNTLNQEVDIKVKRFFRLHEVKKDVFARMTVGTMKNEGPLPKLIFPLCSGDDDKDGVVVDSKTGILNTSNNNISNNPSNNNISNNTSNNTSSNNTSNNNISNNNISNNRVMLAHSLYILSITKSPWITAISKRNNSLYYYNLDTRLSVFEQPANSKSDYEHTTTSSLTWTLNNRTAIHPDIPQPTNPFLKNPINLDHKPNISKLNPSKADSNDSVVTKERFLQHLGTLP